MSLLSLTISVKSTELQVKWALLRMFKYWVKAFISDLFRGRLWAWLNYIGAEHDLQRSLMKV